MYTRRWLLIMPDDEPGHFQQWTTYPLPGTVAAVYVEPEPNRIVMILLVAIVQSEDSGRLSDRLTHAGCRFTRVNAGGGFLGSGSTVLLIGVAEDQLPAVVEVIAVTCRTRPRITGTAAWTGMVGGYAAGGMLPAEVIVGGAQVIGIPAERFLQLGGHPPLPEIDTSYGDTAFDARGTRLVVAIVQKEYADSVVSALTAASHRLTRLDSTGGFLRRSSAALLIGVPASRLPDVLALIELNCRPQAEASVSPVSAPNPGSAGVPVYAATVFVLNTSHFLRF